MEASKLLRVLLVAADHEKLSELSRGLFNLHYEVESCSHVTLHDRDFAVFGAIPGYQSTIPKPVDLLVVLAQSESDFELIKPIVKSVSYVIHKLLVSNLERDASFAELTQGLGFNSIVPEVSSLNIDLILKVEDELVQAIRHIFNTFDTDSSGSIDFQEFVKAIAELGDNLTDFELLQGFGELDIDKNGLISFEEFLIWWKSGRESKSHLWKELVDQLGAKLTPEVTTLVEDFHKAFGETDDMFDEINFSLNVGEVSEAAISATLKLSSSSELEVEKLAASIGAKATPDEIFILLRFKASQGDAESVKNQISSVISELTAIVSLLSARYAYLVEHLELTFTAKNEYVEIYAKLDNSLEELSQLESLFEILKKLYQSRIAQYLLFNVKTTNGFSSLADFDLTKLLEGLSFNFRLKVLKDLFELLLGDSLSEYGPISNLVKRADLDLSFNSFSQVPGDLQEVIRSLVDIQPKAVDLKRSASDIIEESPLPTSQLVRLLKLVDTTVLTAAVSVYGLTLSLNLKAPGLSSFLAELN